jgi:hypothetical protein
MKGDSVARPPVPSPTDDKKPIDIPTTPAPKGEPENR